LDLGRKKEYKAETINGKNEEQNEEKVKMKGQNKDKCIVVPRLTAIIGSTKSIVN
jgi:hypothetical protein